VAAGALTILYFRHKQRKRRRFSTKALNKSLNDEVRNVISRVERITSTLKEGGNGSYLVGGENVQSLHNQLTELSQVLKDWSQSRGSVCALSALAVLESNNISMVIPEDDKGYNTKIKSK
jgi:phosphotransferase system IIB component